MRTYVFTDEALASHAGQFVWLAMNVEKEENAWFRAKFPIRALPTYFILNPEKETADLRWVGGATAAQLAEILNQGSLAYASLDSAVDEEEAQNALLRADRIYAEGNNEQAAAVYMQALELAPEGWAQFGRVSESLLLALYLAGQYGEGAIAADALYPRVRGTSSAVNVAVMGLDCALQLPTDYPLRHELLQRLEAGSWEALKDPAVKVAADDRSGLYGSLVSAREEAGDEAGAKEVAAEWAEFLETAAAAASSPAQRTVYDSHRLSAYIVLEQPERALPMLEESEQDFPDDYNPPARLAVAYKYLERWEEGLAASDRALALAYGPRKLRIFDNKAAIYKAMGDVTAARTTLEEAIAYGEALPEAQKSTGRMSSLRKKLADLG